MNEKTQKRNSSKETKEQVFIAATNATLLVPSSFAVEADGTYGSFIAHAGFYHSNKIYTLGVRIEDLKHLVVNSIQVYQVPKEHKISKRPKKSKKIKKNKQPVLRYRLDVSHGPDVIAQYNKLKEVMPEAVLSESFSTKIGECATLLEWKIDNPMNTEQILDVLKHGSNFHVPKRYEQHPTLEIVEPEQLHNFYQIK